MIHIPDFIKYFQQQPKPHGTVHYISEYHLCWYMALTRSGSAKIIFNWIGFSLGCCKDTSECFCISRLAGLSYPSYTGTGPNCSQTALSISGIPWGHYVWMKQSSSLEKKSLVLMLQGSVGLFPPWPRCNDLACPIISGTSTSYHIEGQVLLCPWLFLLLCAPLLKEDLGT